MKIELKLIFLVFTLFCYEIVSSQDIIDQSSNSKPDWIEESPTGDSYKYYTGIGSSTTSLESAQESAIGNVLSQISFNDNTTIQVERTYTKEENVDIDLSGEEKYSYNEDYIQVINSSGEEIVIRGLQKEEDYWQKVLTNDKIEYQYWVLMKIPKNGASPKEIKQGYGMSGVWRSAVVPGWGQFYKKERNKGIGFLSSAGLFAIGTVVTYSQYKSNLRLAQQNSNIYVRTQYIDRADNWRNGSYFCIAGFAAIYIYNIIDASTSRGAKKYAGLIRNSDTNFYAYYDDNKILNFGLTYKF